MPAVLAKVRTDVLSLDKLRGSGGGGGGGDGGGDGGVSACHPCTHTVTHLITSLFFLFHLGNVTSPKV